MNLLQVLKLPMRSRGELARLNFAKKNLGGFTLIEMIVAIGVFSFMIVVVLGSLLMVINAQRKAFYIRQAQDNARFALERMAREIRLTQVSTNPRITTANGGNDITFVNSKGQTITYSYIAVGTSKRIDRYREYGASETSDACDAKFNPPASRNCPLTDEQNLKIDGVQFVLSGQDPTDKLQPKVTIIMRVNATDPRGRLITTLDMQTTVSLLEVDG